MAAPAADHAAAFAKVKPAARFLKSREALGLTIIERGREHNLIALVLEGRDPLSSRSTPATRTDS